MASYDTAAVGVAPYPKASPQNPMTAANSRPIDYATVSAEAAAARRGLGSRIRSALAYIIAGADAPMAFFGPMQPLTPLAQEPEQGAEGRAFDYPVGFNQRIQPRQDELASFPMLRNLADGYDLMRLIIETRKDQIAGQRFKFGPKDRAKKDDAGDKARTAQLQRFFEMPDRFYCWDDWLRMLMEQLFVYDAPALWPEMTRGGDLYALHVLDGATITRKLTLDGRTPMPNDGPAYQQILKGMPAVDYVVPVPRGTPPPMQDNGFPMPELIYRPRNPRVDRVYGYGPVEQVITTVNIALRRQLYQTTYYTSGSTPDLIIRVPVTWNPDQIANFQRWWDGLLSGNLENRRGTMFVPDGIDPYDTKEKALKDEYDEWLARIICFAFSISPQPFVKEMNRATAQTNQQQSKIEGLQPILKWIAGLVDQIIAVKFGWPDLCLRWEEEEALDAVQQQAVYSGYAKAKVFHPDEIRAKLGEDPMPTAMREQMDLATFVESSTTVLPPDQQEAQHAQAIALAAARPAPVVGAKEQAAAEKADFAALMKAMQTQPAPITVTVHPPEINLPAAAPVNVTVEPATVKVDAPITVNPSDVFVDVGATNVVTKNEPAPLEVKKAGPARDPDGTLRTPDGRRVNRSVTYGRDADGNLVGKIVDSTTRTIRASKDDAGRLLAKVED